MVIPIYTYVTVNSELTQNKLKSIKYLHLVGKERYFRPINSMVEKVYRSSLVDKSPLRSDHNNALLIPLCAPWKLSPTGN